jgi:hypothetical protein
MTGPVLRIAAESRVWRRQLGPMAWAALEHLALAAQPDEAGWVAPVGVRDVAAGLGVTKDTASRAVAALLAASLVTFERLDHIELPRRTGYRLHVPDGIQLEACPTGQDTPLPQRRGDLCPDTADRTRCPNLPDSTPVVGVSRVEPEAQGGARCQPRRRLPNRSLAPVTQPTLFDPPDPAT